METIVERIRNHPDFHKFITEDGTYTLDISHQGVEYIIERPIDGGGIISIRPNYQYAQLSHSEKDGLEMVKKLAGLYLSTVFKEIGSKNYSEEC